MRVHFACQKRDSYCMFRDDFLFDFKTRHSPLWLHLMFLQARLFFFFFHSLLPLQMESNSLEATGEVLCQSSEAFSTLSHCWQCLPSTLTKGRLFVTLVTSAFPAQKEQEKLLKELQDANYFDCFTRDPTSNKWSCFSCSHPEKAK